MRIVALRAALAFFAVSCTPQPPASILICHNANCADPGTYDRDNTLDSLRRSLALRLDGRPPIDGVEMDIVWERESGRCVFAHTADDPSSPDAHDAVKPVIERLSDPGDVSWNRDRFYMKFELKPNVDAANDGHTDAEAISHAECVLDLMELVSTAAGVGHHGLTFDLDSVDPTLLIAVTARPRWPGKRTGGPVDVLFEVPFDGASPAALDVDLLTVRWAEIDNSLRDEFAARGKKGLAWGRDPGADTLGKLADFAPAFIGSNDAMLVRSWLEERK